MMDFRHILVVVEVVAFTHDLGIVVTVDMVRAVQRGAQAAVVLLKRVLGVVAVTVVIGITVANRDIHIPVVPVASFHHHTHHPIHPLAQQRLHLLVAQVRLMVLQYLYRHPQSRQPLLSVVLL
jgi:hypothetical protein